MIKQLIAGAVGLVLGLVLCAGIAWWIGQPKQDTTYKAEFNKLIQDQRKEFQDSLGKINDRMRIRETRINRAEFSLKNIEEKLTKYPAKYEKNRNDVRAIPDDSLASEFSKEFR